MKKNLSFFFVILSLVFAVSCSSTKKVAYFQDAAPGSEFELPKVEVVKIGVADQLSISVNSKDPELASIFNLQIISHMQGTTSTVGNSSNRVPFYTVDEYGYIDFPVLGRLHILGMTREQVAELIKQKIIAQHLIKDPVVIVEFAGMYVSVLGDVKSPGRFPLDKDKTTVLDVLSKAGDMNVTGIRNTVKVYREENGKQVCYNLDFTSAENIFTSPVYYMHQDDVVYVEPNKMKMRQSTVNGNTLMSVSFWISLSSFLTSVVSLVVLNLKK